MARLTGGTHCWDVRNALPKARPRVITRSTDVPNVGAMRKHYWFARRRSSYGGVPITWQGWSSVVVLAVVAATAAALLPLLASVPVVTLAALAFLAVSVAKGPIHTSWHWAGQDD